MFGSSVCSPSSPVVVCISMFRSCWVTAESGRNWANGTGLCVRHSTKGWLLTTSPFYPQPHTLVPSQKLLLAVRSREGLESTDIYQDDFQGTERRIISQVINSLSTRNGDGLVCFLSDLKSTVILKVTCLLHMLVKFINEGSILCFILSTWQKS